MASIMVMMKKSKKNADKSNHKNSSKKKLLVVLLGILGLLLALFVCAYMVFHHYYSLMNYQDGSAGQDITAEIEFIEIYETDAEAAENALTESEVAEVDKILEENKASMESAALEEYENQKDIFNILLIGVDSRKNNFSGRSDVMMLFSINKTEKKVVMTSFLRDMYVAIPGHSNNRLNAAYAFGGSELLCETIQANFGIEVDRCVAVNFMIVMDMVDAVGGIDLDVTKAEIKVMNGYIAELNTLRGEDRDTDKLTEEGYLHLNGKQAVAYSRNRYVGQGDFSRTERQRKVLMCLYEKVKEMSLLEMNGLLETFLSQIATDLSQEDCLSLLWTALDMKNYTIESLSLPIEGTWSNKSIKGMSVLTVDFQENAEYWKEKVYGEGE